MPRYCFRLHVQPDLLPEYTRRHAAVWPEMVQALAESGWRNYTIFAAPDGTVIGYLEADDLTAAQQAMARTEVNDHWQREMARYFVGLDGGSADQGFELLDEIFNVDDQRAALRSEDR